ncbi:MAG TPA: hypothetical protein VIK32_13230 [Candidatus Limnocylindrales bacterium]
MSEKSHWPFASDAGTEGTRDSRSREAEAEKARLADQAAAHHLRIRHDRLIVGGRAHIKKSGLS